MIDHFFGNRFRIQVYSDHVIDVQTKFLTGTSQMILHSWRVMSVYLKTSFKDDPDDWHEHVNLLELDLFQKHDCHSIQYYFVIKGSLTSETKETPYDLETNDNTLCWTDFISGDVIWVCKIGGSLCKSFPLWNFVMSCDMSSSTNIYTTHILLMTQKTIWKIPEDNSR